MLSSTSEQRRRVGKTSSSGGIGGDCGGVTQTGVCGFGVNVKADCHPKRYRPRAYWQLARSTTTGSSRGCRFNSLCSKANATRLANRYSRVLLEAHLQEICWAPLRGHGRVA
jgi:hypothetical protein